jgi:hypothetical protein
MKLSEYFENVRGKGILAIASKFGVVNVSLYTRPYFMDEKTICFIMGKKLLHENLHLNPHASYLFIEDREEYAGKRIHLTKIKEEKDSKLIKLLMRERLHISQNSHSDDTKCLVCFRILQVLPLVEN